MANESISFTGVSIENNAKDLTINTEKTEVLTEGESYANKMSNEVTVYIKDKGSGRRVTFHSHRV